MSKQSETATLTFNPADPKAQALMRTSAALTNGNPEAATSLLLTGGMLGIAALCEDPKELEEMLKIMLHAAWKFVNQDETDAEDEIASGNDNNKGPLH